MQNDLIRRGDLYEKLKWIPLDGEERDTIMRIIDMVLEAPAVDAVPVVLAVNVAAAHPSDMFVCSNCGFTCEINELVYEDEDDSGMGVPTAHEYECKHCPDCGAKICGGTVND